jgi:mono/diheme cytochrome c family protein
VRALGALLLLIVVVAAAVIVGAYVWPAPALPKVTPVQPAPEVISRGQYIATAADCIACHTVRGGAPFAGGRAFDLPFGTIYSTNITPDKATGIGAWTDAQFVRALRSGVAADGTQLYPAFPYTSYHRMTDADALALRAYLDSVPAAHAPAKPDPLAFPFDQRPLLRLWKLVFMPRGGPFAADAHRDAQWNRGAYLVTTLGHCGECHTPRNLAYGMEGGQALAGGTIQGWSAWNLTADPHHGLGKVGQAQLIEYLRYGYAPGLGGAGGPMREAIDDSLSKLTDADLVAIAAYLKSVPAKARGPTVGETPQAIVAGGPASPLGGAAPSPGQRIFEGACAGCHAWNGQGQVDATATLAGLPAVNDPHALNVMQTVLHGAASNSPEGHGWMPSFSAGYSNAEIAAVANYAVGRFGGVSGQASARDVAKARAQ